MFCPVYASPLITTTSPSLLYGGQVYLILSRVLQNANYKQQAALLLGIVDRVQVYSVSNSTDIQMSYFKLNVETAVYLTTLLAWKTPKVGDSQ
jgi:hypothetical protein